MAKPRGLYEDLLTEALTALLSRLPEHLRAEIDHLNEAEAADRISLHAGRTIKRLLSDVSDLSRIDAGTRLVQGLLELAKSQELDVDLALEQLDPEGRVLRSIVGRQPDGSFESIAAPLIPLLDTALLTNAPGEPRVGSQILAEIHSADRIDLLMAFIRRTGIAPLREAIRAHCSAGRPLRVLTTTYTRTTEGEALEELAALGAEVRVSYDLTGTRLHAKSWLFHRDSGFSTAYIGSSNLTHSAQVTGLEWNVRVSAARNPDVVEKVSAVFESYWNSGDFVAFDREQFRALTAEAAEVEGFVLSPLEVRLEPFQERLLEEVAVSRERGHHANLLVSATGTGKTVMAAVDYGRLQGALARSRLLFIAHRQEILAQARDTFRHVLRDPSFGELWVAGERPSRFEHVFASIQSLNATQLSNWRPDHFDVVIIDEFHHAAAASYQALLDHVRPQELLGLTATPERSDGLPILNWFGGRIAAELRLWDAIDQQRLAPFSYFGLHDSLDLRQIPWRRGQGYDVEALTNLLTASDVNARLVANQIINRVDEVRRMRALGFCVSVEHARFMARIFNEIGIPSQAIWGASDSPNRTTALKDLANRTVNVIFSVDLFNEGVDVPSVDTILMLRPTDSPTLFIQQLGRGLRKSPGKAQCLVLDFVGHHRKEFRFDRRLRALIGGTRPEVERQVEQGFPFLPAGCHMELDRVAREIVLTNLRAAVPARWPSKVQELQAYAQDSEGDVSLRGFLRASELEPEDVYQGIKSWSDLRQDAGLSVLSPGPNEDALRKACGRLLHIDDALRLDHFRALLESETPPNVQLMTETDRRLTRMFVGSIVDTVVKKGATLQEGLDLIWLHPQIRSELRDLFDVLADRVNHLHPALQKPDGVPLCIHAKYSRIEILAAMGVGDGARVADWQTGCRWVEDAKTDVFAFTLDKTSGQFSPTTRYRDYAISRDLLHWESQSVTRELSDTGQRYIHHVKLGTTILLFGRLRRNERAFWFLGPATYVRHESEMPIAITWRLEHPMPGDVFEQFAAAVA